MRTREQINAYWREWRARDPERVKQRNEQGSQRHFDKMAERPAVLLACPGCGTEFKPRNGHQTYCTRRCQGRHWKATNPDLAKEHTRKMNAARYARAKADPQAYAAYLAAHRERARIKYWRDKLLEVA